MPSAVCRARISLRTFTASLRVAGRQLQRTTSANPSTTCSTLDRGLRSRERERLLPELCIRKREKKDLMQLKNLWAFYCNYLMATEESAYLHFMALVAGMHCLTPLTDELQQHLHRIVQKCGVNVSHLSDNEVHKAWENILPPLWKIHHQGLEGGEGKAPQLLVHVDRQPGGGDGRSLLMHAKPSELRKIVVRGACVCARTLR